jgi:hypothetical protein
MDCVVNEFLGGGRVVIKMASGDLAEVKGGVVQLNHTLGDMTYPILKMALAPTKISIQRPWVVFKVLGVEHPRSSNRKHGRSKSGEDISSGSRFKRGQGCCRAQGYLGAKGGFPVMKHLRGVGESSEAGAIGRLERLECIVNKIRELLELLGHSLRHDRVGLRHDCTRNRVGRLFMVVYYVDTPLWNRLKQKLSTPDDKAECGAYGKTRYWNIQSCDSAHDTPLPSSARTPLDAGDCCLLGPSSRLFLCASAQFFHLSLADPHPSTPTTTILFAPHSTP